MGMWTIPKEPDNQQKFSAAELEEFSASIASAVHARGMSVPVIMALEMVKPLSFIGYSSLVIFGPILEMIIDPVKMEKFQALLADRNCIERLMVSIEELEKSKKDTKEGESREQR
ncbi:MAG: hypothetical protein CVV42_20890 [Candidatus Riflebacteria bacterium HGW-Riflebacteria-2]|jgi:hypothetical protein|nr:MAG: hypothetical protein CVV42_20890 [Candidatus Riflebacteria bacterium HGW-Riflebacteria-2]